MGKQLLYILAAALVPLTVGADDDPNAEGDCRYSSVGMIIPGSLPRAMVAQGRIIEDRARTLADAYHQVVSVLREAGYDPDMFPNEGRSWTGVVRGGEVLVAVYDRDEGRIVRRDALGTERNDTLLPLVGDVEQALAHTPEDCGTAFGVMDAGMTDENGDELLYSLRLGNGQQHVWGMHYRFHRRDGELAHVERLHVICEAQSTVVTDLMLERMPEAIRRAVDPDRFPSHPRFLGGSNLPGHDMPTEAQLLQFHSVPDFYYARAHFRVRDGIVRVDPRAVTVSNRFTRIRNACDVVERTDG